MRFRRKGLRAVTRGLTVATLALTSLAVTGGAASAEEEDVPPVIVLTASQYTAASDNSVTLYAEANEAELNTSLQIVDALGGYVVASCGSTTSCYAYVSEDSGSRTFYAQVVVNSTSLPTNVRSVSNTVTVHWHEPSLVSLTATPPTTTTGTSVRLDAVADDVYYNSWITIWEVTNPSSPTLVHQCSGATCSTTVSRATAGTRDFVAHVSDWWQSGQYYWYYDGTSGTTRATWVNPPGGGAAPSTLCDSGQQVVDSTTQGYRVKMYYVQPSANETDVCVRIQDSTGYGFGGQFVITPTVPGYSVTNVQQPSSDDQSGACTATTPNAVPGSHPVSSGGVAGQTYLVDAYAKTGEAWICLKAGSSNVRLKVPVAVPGVTVTPGTQVQFLPDPGTPDVV